MDREIGPDSLLIKVRDLPNFNEFHQGQSIVHFVNDSSVLCDVDGLMVKCSCVKPVQIL
jgi:hypothetical protein